MALRTGHGTGAGVPRIEVLPADELPMGLPGSMPVETRSDRGDGGRFAPGNAGPSRKGGLAKKAKVRLAVRLGLGDLSQDAAFAPYQRSAGAFRRQHCAALAATVGGGVCGTGPSSMVASAALQLAWSRFLFDQAAATGDTSQVALAKTLSDSSRQNLMAAYEYAAKEATARAKTAPPIDVAALLEAGMAR
jgi:hypothetical protein